MLVFKFALFLSFKQILFKKVKMVLIQTINILSNCSLQNVYWNEINKLWIVIFYQEKKHFKHVELR